jgi:hypothetical protein
MNLRRILAVVALAWLVVNAWGLIWALVNGEGMHAMTHGVLLVALAAGAAWLWKKPRTPKPHALGDPSVDVLHDEISHLQRELSETKEGLAFAEQLLAAKKKEAQPAESQRYAPKTNDDASSSRPV